MNSRIINANYNEKTVRVYQAYSEQIALPALEVGTFVEPFKLTRMTWIKPSFNWMMYRAGYGEKDGQEYILAIDIYREGFDWALENSVLSTFNPDVHGSFENWKNLLRESPVRVQWDPARNWRLGEIPELRAIQIGLVGTAVRKYVNEWISSISDVTSTAHSLAKARASNEQPAFLPDALETAYPVTSTIKERLLMRD